MADYRGVLANYLGGGEATSKTPDGRWIRNKTVLSLAGFEVEILQHPGLIAKPTLKYRGQFVHTTDVIFRNVPEKKVRFVNRAISDVAQMLSFAAVSPVRFFAYEYPTGSKRGSRWSTYGVLNTVCPVIPIHDSAAVREFLTQSWAAYRREKARRRLPVVFDLLWLPEQPTHPIESRLLLLVTALETLKHTYAVQAGLRFNNGRFRSASGRPYSFRELLTKMLRAQGMRRGLKQLVGLRNQVVHEGLPNRRFEAKRRMYRKCHDLIREYLLRLLEYSGPWMSFEKLAVRQLRLR